MGLWSLVSGLATDVEGVDFEVFLGLSGVDDNVVVGFRSVVVLGGEERREKVSVEGGYVVHGYGRA